MVVLSGDRVTLRPPEQADVAVLVAIRAQEEVYRFWRGGDDLAKAVREDYEDDETTPFVIVFDGAVVGWIQYSEELEPDYRSASIDIYVDGTIHRQGIGSDALRTMARYLFDERGHHRIEIDPAAHNDAAIACYTSIGFRRVGILQQSERGPDGTWHDGLFMDMLRSQLREPSS